MYVRALLTEPDGVPVEVEERLVALYEPDERDCVMAAMKGMFCTNLLVNTWRSVLPAGDDTCSMA